MGIELYRHSRKGTTDDSRSGTLAEAPMRAVVKKQLPDGSEVDVTSIDVAAGEHVVIHCHELTEETAPDGP
jgi:hypothetical protein